MIEATSYTKDWILNIRNQIGKRIDPKMIEKVIYALSLLEQLVAENLKFIFKGGTCILLTSPTPTRFSIDIDIITIHNETEIIAVLEKIVDKSIFTKWEPDNDRKNISGAPISHFKLFYNSAIDNSFGEEPILLDVLYTSNPYPKLLKIPVVHAWLKNTGKSITVNIPTYDCILGDKLTAFAPKTTGILYIKGRPVEIIKQLYDIGFLFDHIGDMQLIKTSYKKIVTEELSYRKLKMTYSQVLDDTLQACFKIAARNEDDEDFKLLLKGVTNITNFIIGRFKIEDAICIAGKIAYLCLLLKDDSPRQPNYYTSPEQIKNLTIINMQYNWLNKLKKSNPEAFFYWGNAIALIV